MAVPFGSFVIPSLAKPIYVQLKGLRETLGTTNRGLISTGILLIVDLLEEGRREAVQTRLDAVRALDA